MKIISLLFIILFLSISCSHYIDSSISKSQTVKDIGLIVYEQYDLFRYMPTFKLIKDKEVTLPVKFEVKLPKKMKYFSSSNGSDFGFYYDRNQVIFIKTGLKDSLTNDKNYEPSSEELGSLIQDQLMTARGKFDIKKIIASPQNKSIIIRRGNVLILLYNISKDNINAYVHLVNTIK